MIFIAKTVLTLLACCWISSSVANTVVTTDQGQLEGIERGAITAYLGIEYATAKRWEPSTAGPGWKGVRSASEPGPACPQEGLESLNEDCLFLNVYQPTKTRTDKALPVLVWIHGGGFRVGEGGDGPNALVAENIIVVTFNYRLGVLGFHDWPGWTENDVRNFGQGDMIQALGWVQRNIAAFGGDVGNITLAGHSAGGMGVQLMMVDPRARGLFSRAISDSGYGTWPFPQALNPDAEQRALIRFRALERDTPVAELVARTPFYHLPYVGGADLPLQPIDIFQQGHQAPVPYMAGGNSYDGHQTLTGAGFEASSFLARYQGRAALKEHYAADFAVSAKQAAAHLFGDMRYVFAAWQTARFMQRAQQPGYLFYYTAPGDGLPGAAHGAHYRELLGAGPSDLRAYWLSFIRSGTPAPKSLPGWPAYTDANDIWMVFDPGARPTPGAYTSTMRLLAPLPFPDASR